MSWHLRLYAVCFPVGFMLMAPYYALRARKRGKASENIQERWGKFSAQTLQTLESWGEKRPLWIHAVSVGEVKIAQVLIRQLRLQKPEQTVVLTTTTQTGRALAQKLADERTLVLYNPFDFAWVVRRFFSLIRPSQYILVEGEIWPQCLAEAQQRDIPTCLINARLSDRSWKRYRALRWLARPILDHFTWIGIQHESERLRFAQAGFPPHKLFNTGSLKFDVASTDNLTTELAESLRSQLQWNTNDPVLVAGSTAEGEEELILHTFAKLKTKHPNLRCVLAPRHVERCQPIEAQLKNYTYIRRSALRQTTPTSAPEILLVDTTGELNQLYALGSIVIVCRSFVNLGGSNFLEPAHFAKPIVTGKYMSNFNALTQLYLEKQALKQCHDEAHFFATLEHLLDNPQEAQAMGQRAKETLAGSLGSAKKTAELILA